MKNDAAKHGKNTKAPRRAASEIRLISNIGNAASRLFDAIGYGREGTMTGDEDSAKERRKKPKRPALVEQALDAATEVESFLAEQSVRITSLENLTLTDELTGLHNRRGFNEQLRRTIAAANRYGNEGVLVFCDLDNFKAVNDSFGHHVGDFVLRKVVRVLEAQLRETDIVARLGAMNSPF